MRLSVVIPAHNEEECIERVVLDLERALGDAAVPHETVVVDDNSTDRTGAILDALSGRLPSVRVAHRREAPGFGRAIRAGLAAMRGECCAIVMGDGSDDPADVVLYYRKLMEGYDCVYGSRFIRGGVVKDYPRIKLWVNRLANTFLRVLFWTHHNDLTNAFKAFRTEVIRAIEPIQANHFNITVEMSLKPLVRGAKIAVVPISWYGRTAGVTKLRINVMGRKYLFTALYVWLEKHLIADELAGWGDPRPRGGASERE
ncbi:MAG: glycosyltransferase family 2 protein [Armatimonadetes bacterium]|nr:glycosyltransferase family 2 protein [Armatimonadota bacterium]